MNKTVLITGSNSGIGKLTAELFAKNNWHVLATMRSKEKAGALANKKNVRIYELDVTNSESLDRSKKEILRDFEKVDVIVNNAGFGVYGAFEEATESEIDQQWGVNVKGLMMVTKKWLPHFRENNQGLFINISSVSGIASYPLATLYISSKWAVEGFSESLAYELAPFHIKVKLVEPGGFRTNFQTSSITWTNDASISAYRDKVNALRASRDGRWKNMPEPFPVAEKILEAANDPSDRLRYLVGEDAHKMMKFRNENGPEAYVKKYLNDYLKRE